MDEDFEMDEAELERMEEEMLAEQAAAKSSQPEPDDAPTDWVAPFLRPPPPADIASRAIALAMYVLPVPGGPERRSWVRRSLHSTLPCRH